MPHKGSVSSWIANGTRRITTRGATPTNSNLGRRGTVRLKRNDRIRTAVTTKQCLNTTGQVIATQVHSLHID